MAAPPDPIEQLKSESHHIIKNHDMTDSSLPVHQITTVKLSIQKSGANIIINKKAQPRLTLLRRTTIMVVLRTNLSLGCNTHKDFGFALDGQIPVI